MGCRGLGFRSFSQASAAQSYENQAEAESHSPSNASSLPSLEDIASANEINGRESMYEAASELDNDAGDVTAPDAHDVAPAHLSPDPAGQAEPSSSLSA